MCEIPGKTRVCAHEITHSGKRLFPSESEVADLTYLPFTPAAN